MGFFLSTPVQGQGGDAAVHTCAGVPWAREGMPLSLCSCSMSFYPHYGPFTWQLGLTPTLFPPVSWNCPFQPEQGPESRRNHRSLPLIPKTLGRTSGWELGLGPAHLPLSGA